MDPLKCDAWQRLCAKVSPSHCCGLSPLKPISYHLLSSDHFQEDPVVIAIVWTVLNNEEFLYHNVTSLVNFHSTKVSNLGIMLRSNMNVANWHERLIDKEYLGKGSFGIVFKAKDKLTQKTYVLKLLKASRNFDLDNLFLFLSRLLVERTIMSELNRCIFFVRLLSAFQNVDNTFTFLLEYCLCDLKKLYSFHPYASNNEQLVILYKEASLSEIIAKKMKKLLKVNYYKLIYMYFFEMLCGLHYLASRHVIHADIKPENILISESGHIKITDLGLAYRNNWFDRSSIVMLPVHEDDVEDAILRDEDGEIIGSKYYFDPEMKIQLFMNKEDQQNNIEKYFENNEYFLSLTDTSQNFLSDLYALGVTFFELCFVGFKLFEFPLFKRASDKFWSIEIIFNTKYRQKTLINPISKMSKEDDSLSVMNFLLSILQPREIRAQDFLKDIFIYKQAKLIKSRCIDINQVENIPYYKLNSVTKENVTNIIIPQKFLFVILSHSQSETLDSKDSESSDDDSDEDACEQITYRINPFEYMYV